MLITCRLIGSGNDLFCSNLLLDVCGLLPKVFTVRMDADRTPFTLHVVKHEPILGQK